MNIPEPVRILDTTIHPVRFREVVRFIDESVKSHDRAILLPMNIHILAELSKNPDFKKNHETADIIFCDGVPLVWLSRINKHPLPERVSGTDLAETLLKKPYKIYLLGSTPEVLTIMKQKHPSVCGAFSPSFKNEWGRSEIRSMVKQINASKADVLLVAFGPLKQEHWVLDNFTAFHVPVTITIGSALDILSGKTPRAPRWMQQYGLEWFWRFTKEPKRLGIRYVSDLFFLTNLLLDP
jgi:N-acetylglucosaminyldiphosphoundecaprenol N-acetyl-beta-D-mannosaminyltransferase